MTSAILVAFSHHSFRLKIGYIGIIAIFSAFYAGSMLYSALVGLGLACAVYYLPIQTPAPSPAELSLTSICEAQGTTGGTEVIQVMIHGALYVPLALLSPLGVLTGTLENTWYRRTHTRLRAQCTTTPGGIILPHGLREVTSIVTASELPACAQHQAIYHVLRIAHEYIATGTEGLSAGDPELKACTRTRWFTFGWSGLMSEQERWDATVELYEALALIHAEALGRGVTPQIHLYAHSHGGQLPLQLPLIRKERNDKHLIIDRLVLTAVPLFRQNTRNLLVTTDDHVPMFRAVWNLYAPGDFAQTIDYFSVPERRCFQELRATIPFPRARPDIRIHDVAITIDNKFSVPHRAFFDIGIIEPSPRRRRRSRRYQERYNQAHYFTHHLSPFPLAALYPPLIGILQQQDGDALYSQSALAVSGTETEIIAHHRSTTTGESVHSIAITPLIRGKKLFCEAFGPIHNPAGFSTSLLCQEIGHALLALFY
jgi:hypothetical protein